MQRKLIDVPEGICDYPTQPRSFKPRSHVEALFHSIKKSGQQIPALGWFKGERFQLYDGGCRLEAIRLAGLPTILAMDLGKEPAPLELFLAQAAIDLHKQHLPPVDRARLFANIMAEGGLNGKQTAEALGISPSLVSFYLPLLDLASDLQEMVNAEGLELTKAVPIARATKDHEQQRELAKAASGMSRQEVVASAKRATNGNDQPAVKVSRLKLLLPSRMTVTIAVEGDGVTLDQIVEQLTELLKQARKANDESLDARTFARVLADKSRG